MSHYNKSCTSVTNTAGLLEKLFARKVVTQEQIHLAHELIRETSIQNCKKKANRTLLLGRYLLGILQPSRTPASNATASPWKERIEVKGRNNGEVEALGTYSSYEQATYFASEYSRANPAAEVTLRVLPVAEAA